jgi:hypothetical protein
VLDAAWKDWYFAKHAERSLATGEAFESYIDSVLRQHHDDFTNPRPMGSFGDGGCDGLGDAGRILYAMYGSRPMADAERRHREKIRGDFERALNHYDFFEVWRFVTNAPLGIECAKYLTQIRRAHGPASDRPILIQDWDAVYVWNNIMTAMPWAKLDRILPGAPGLVNLELIDMVPLLESLDGAHHNGLGNDPVRPVPPHKMSYNQLPETAMMEFNAGRVWAHPIELWFREQDPELRDRKALTFRSIYEAARFVTQEPAEVLERVYVALGGPNFRLDARRANAVYAVTAFFFDSCDIFEEPPAELRGA